MKVVSVVIMSIPVLLPVVIANDALAAHSWVTEGIDAPAYVVYVMERGLGPDAQGNPHLVYGGRDGFHYARCDGSGWQIEQVAGLCAEYTSASIDLTPGNEPRIAFSGNDGQVTGRYLGYASRDAAGWHLAIVDSAGDTGDFPCLALDPMGRSHVVYHAGVYAPGSLKYAVCDEGSWLVETIDVPETPGAGFSLALDSYSCPCVAYLDGVNGRLMYAYFDGIVWDRMTVDDQGLIGMYNSIVMDSQDDPHIAYYDERLRDLKYARLVGTTWQVEVVDSLGFVGQYISLALDAGGCPHISYQDATTPALKHAVKREGVWEIESVAAGAMPIGTSLALDDAGAVCIAFYDLESNLVRYARQIDDTWTIDPVERSGCISENLSLTVDAGGEPMVAYRDEISTDLRCARRDGDGWTIEVVDSDGEVGNNPSIGVAQDGALHLSHCDWGNKDLKHAWQDGSGWQIEIVDEGGNVGRYTSLAVDGSGMPCISYYDETNDALKYAHRGAGGWEIEEAATAGGRYTSVTLDQSGMPHISHYDLTQQDLKYTYKSEAGWTTEAVDKPGNVGSCSSIAVDAAGRPHISYLEIIPNTCPILAWVKHAYRGEAGWEIEVVEQSVGYSNTSIRMDGAGYPCIAFSGVEGGLWYARCDNAGWQIEVADSSEGAGYCPSLGIGPEGEIHIAHADRDRYDLLYTCSMGVGAEKPVPVAGDVRLLSISPNPARDRVSIVYSGGESDQVTLRIYDLAGRLVAVPVAGVTWRDPRPADWRIGESEARPGVYVVRAQSPDARVIDRAKLVIVR